MTPGAQLEAGLQVLGLALPGETRAQLLEYLALLRKWNRAYSLTAVDEPERMVTHHLLDSLAVLPALEQSLPALRRLADVGSGAGLPGIPLALARPRWEVALVEPSHKKAAFLRQAVIELKVANVEVVAQRAQDWRRAEGFDVVVSRAFADLADLVAAAGHLCAAGGRVAAMKGVHPDEELAGLPAGTAVERVVPLEVPGLAARRHLVILKMS